MSLQPCQKWEETTNSSLESAKKDHVLLPTATSLCIFHLLQQLMLPPDGINWRSLLPPGGFLQWEVFFRVSYSVVVRESAIPWGFFNTHPCHSLVISLLQACPSQPCLTSNCWRNQNTRYGSCRYSVEKNPRMHKSKKEREGEKERKHIKGKTTFGAGWCVLDRRIHHTASVIYSSTGWHLCDSQSQSIRWYLPPPCHPFILNSFLPRVEMPQSWTGTNIQTILQGLMNTTKAGLKVGQDIAKGGLSQGQGWFSTIDSGCHIFLGHTTQSELDSISI